MKINKAVLSGTHILMTRAEEADTQEGKQTELWEVVSCLLKRKQVCVVESDSGVRVGVVRPFCTGDF